MATLAERIADAEAAYHALQTGTQARVVVDSDGVRVEFTPATSGKLYQYIQSLYAQAGSSPAPYCGPARFLF